MKFEVSVQTYQMGTHFKALMKAILVAQSRALEKFFFISCLPAALCLYSELDLVLSRVRAKLFLDFTAFRHFQKHFLVKDKKPS